MEEQSTEHQPNLMTHEFNSDNNYNEKQKREEVLDKDLQNFANDTLEIEDNNEFGVFLYFYLDKFINFRTFAKRQWYHQIYCLSH